MTTKDDHSRILETLRKASAEMRRRNRDAAQRGLRQWDGDALTVLVEDCVAALGNPEVRGYLETLACMGRKTGIRIQLSDAASRLPWSPLIDVPSLRDALLHGDEHVTYIQKQSQGVSR